MSGSQRMTLLVLAAGMGSRYGGVKQIDAVGPNGEAIIDYSIYDALAAGFTDICFVIRSEIEDAVREFFAPKLPKDLRVSYAVQSLEDVPSSVSGLPERTKPWGTAHAVYAARHSVVTPFAVVNADDFYGRDSYVQLHRYLTSIPPDSADYAVVGFRLEDTLSPHGTVSRAICTTDDSGYLTSLVERTRIERIGNRVTDVGDDGEVALSLNDVASMNMFGFTPKVFFQTDAFFEAFLKEHGRDPESEFYMPTLVTELINAGKARMKVLSTRSRWFGMTYREDRPTVQEQIRRYIEEGDYPRRLWPR
jgi:UTP-glucose-1-phosphate uridylyltransferase